MKKKEILKLEQMKKESLENNSTMSYEYYTHLMFEHKPCIFCPTRT